MSNDKYEATFHGGGTIVEIVRTAKAEALREAAAEFVYMLNRNEVGSHIKGPILWLEDRAAEIEAGR